MYLKKTKQKKTTTTKQLAGALLHSPHPSIPPPLPPSNRWPPWTAQNPRQRETRPPTPTPPPWPQAPTAVRPTPPSPPPGQVSRCIQAPSPYWSPSSWQPLSCSATVEAPDLHVPPLSSLPPPPPSPPHLPSITPPSPASLLSPFTAQRPRD